MDQPVRVLALGLLWACAAPAQSGEQWVPTWTTAPQAAVRNERVHDQTVRMVVHASIGGPRVRVHLSNAYGTAALSIGSAHIALHGQASEIVAGSDRALTFGGKSSIAIPTGAHVVSDPLEFPVPPLGDLAVSLYVSGDPGAPTMHDFGLHTTYLSPSGDFTGQAAIPDAKSTPSFYWLSGLDVLAPRGASAIVAFGDSITDGNTSTVDANRNWPSVFAQRLLKSNIAVINEGISGNGVLRDITGTNALARLDRDVFSQRGVKWMIYLAGINDIGTATRNDRPRAGVVSAEALIAADKQIVELAHMHGIKVAGGTMTPYAGAAYYSDEGEAIRQAMNRWVRTSGVFDAVLDFDAVLRDPVNPKQIRQDFNLSDHLHPNDAGYKAMADSIDLSIFR